GWSLDWIPVCALAVERQPGADAFFGSMAVATRKALLARAERAAPSSVAFDSERLPEFEGDEEIGLSRVVRRLLAPAESGFFLSRSRLGALALEAGLRLPFGSRHDVARALFEAAGESGRVGTVLGAIGEEADSWDAAYHAIGHAGWRAR